MMRRIATLMRTLAPGEEIKVTVLRGGRRVELATVPIEP
jgi:hypothetical protein